MQLGHPIDGLAADTGQVGHTHISARRVSSINDSRARLGLIAGIFQADLVQEATVDLKDDLQMPGQRPCQKAAAAIFSRASGIRV